MDPKWLMNQTHSELTNWTANSTNSTSLPALDALEWPLQVFLICVYSTTAGLSLAANIVTIIVLIKGERCAKDLSKFLINLSIADIAMAIFSIPFTYTLYMFGRWIFPPIMCPIVNFVQLCSMVVSIYTLAAIGVDRYFAIVHPLRSSVVKSHRTLIVCAIWLFGLVIGCSQLIISRSNSFRYGNEYYYDCKEQWDPNSNHGKVYTIIVFSLTFISPMFVLCLVYTLMAFTLLRHHLPGSETARHRVFATRRIKVVKMLATIVILFILCWLPIQIFGLLVSFYPPILDIDTKYSYYIFVGMYFFCHWISMAHSFMNPIIYSFMSQNFRDDLKSLLKKLWHNINCKTANRTGKNLVGLHGHSVVAIMRNSVLNGNNRHFNKANIKNKEDNYTNNTVIITYV